VDPYEGCDNGEPTPLEFTRFRGAIGDEVIELDVPAAWSVEAELYGQDDVYGLRLGRPQTCQALTLVADWYPPATVINVVDPGKAPSYWASGIAEWIEGVENLDRVVTVLDEYETLVQGARWPTIVGRIDLPADPPPLTTSDQTPIFHTFARINGTTYDFMMYAGADYENSRAIYEHVLGSVAISEN
jgi:hypothetical protein